MFSLGDLGEYGLGSCQLLDRTGRRRRLTAEGPGVRCSETERAVKVPKFRVGVDGDSGWVKMSGGLGQGCYKGRSLSVI